MAVLKLLLGALVVFGGFVALMYVAQRSLMYFPDRERTAPATAGLPSAEEVVLDSEGGARVIIWYVPPSGGNPVLIYFHGNGGALVHRADRFRALTADGTGLVALSYRGYGGSTGSPSETGLIADGEAAYRFVAARYPAERIVLFGESLGTGVAVALAAANRIGGLILQAPFTSAADVAARVYWYLPVRLLMKDPFYSDRRIAQVTVPLLILHGERDRVVPVALGERLYKLANQPKRFVRLPDGGHNDLDEHGVLAEVRAFLDETARRPG
jgi:fermentation-respiration switch protein FrsA (DUF1100 family)